MIAIQYDQCSLCRADATFIWSDHGNRKFFKCGDCGNYKITKTALERLNREQQGIWRLQIAEKARSLLDDTDYMLLIDLDEKQRLRCSKVARA